MALNAVEIAKIGKVAITSYGKNKPIDQMNTDRPLLDALLPKAKDIDGGLDGFTINIFKSNDANGQLYSGNGKVTYNSRSPNDIAKFDWMNHHDGFVLNEDELLRAGITVNDDVGKSTATKGEAVALTNMILSQFTALEEGVKDHIHALLWKDGSDASSQPGIDTLVGLTPSSGTIGNIAASNTYWQNIATANVGTTLAAMLDALEQAKRNIIKRRGKFTHIFVGGSFYDALRNAVIGANVTQVNYGSGSKLSIDMATDSLKFDGIPLTYVPQFDDTSILPTTGGIAFTKRCYMLNLLGEERGGISLHRASSDFMKMRYPGRPIDQYTYHFAMTSKFGLGLGKRNSNAVLSIA